MTIVIRERLINAFITACIGTCFVILGVYLANRYTRWYVAENKESKYEDVIEKLDRTQAGIDSLNVTLRRVIK